MVIKGRGKVACNLCVLQTGIEFNDFDFGYGFYRKDVSFIGQDYGDCFFAANRIGQFYSHCQNVYSENYDFGNTDRENYEDDFILPDDTPFLLF